MVGYGISSEGLRRSERLATNGYYKDDGSPQCSYKETYTNVLKKQQKPKTDPSTVYKINGDMIVTTTSPLSCGLTCYLILLLIITITGFVATLGLMVSSRTPVHNEDEVRRLRNEITNLKKEFDQLSNKLHPQAYSMPDYALNTNGAHVMKAYCSETYFEKHVMGEGAWTELNSPSNVIKGQTYPLIPGHCWAFKGQTGMLYVYLARDVRIKHFTIGHITKTQSLSGKIDTAPKSFTVYAQRRMTEPETKLGTYEYDEDGDSFQTFEVLNHTDEIFRFVRLKIHSNHGSSDFTCLYNFRVHGEAPEVQDNI